MARFGPPPEALEAAARFGSAPHDHLYHAVDGTSPLRERIADKLLRENRIDVTQGRCLFVTAGGNQAFMNAVLAITDPGDEIILIAPFYFNHEMAVRLVGAVPVVVPVGADALPDPARIEAAITRRTRAVVTISPNNPTGAVYPKALLDRISALCRERRLFHISDEPYEYFLWDGATHHSPGSGSQAEGHTISLFSLSKAYGMAGWRIGYMVAPAALDESLRKIQDTLLICPPGVTEAAAEAALRVGRAHAEAHLPAMAAARRAVLDGLARLSDRISVTPSQGGFYLLVRVASDRDPMALARDLVLQYKVGTLPGTSFGAPGCTLRLAFGALDPATAAEATARLAAGLPALA